jgi:prefoldin subunit 5
MNLEQQLALLSSKIEECKQEIRKAETFEVRLFSYRSDEIFKKDLLEENLNVLKEDGIVASLDEYRAVKSSYMIVLNSIRTYDIDLDRLRAAINTYKAKISEIEAESDKVRSLISDKKNNLIYFKRKK